MAPAKKSSPSKTTKKAVSKPAPTHPSWTDMIKECISNHPEDSRHGVSRPQIKKFVEERYQLEIGNAQVTQLSKAIAVGAEKGVFSLPKGPSGRVKIAPKTLKTSDDAKENKPTSKTSKPPTTKTTSKPATKPGSKSKTPTGKSTTATKSSTGRKAPSSKTLGAKASTTKTVKKPTATSKLAKPAVKPSTTKKTEAAPKRTYASKKAPEKKVKSSTSRGSAKKAVTGGTATSKASKAKTASAKKGSSKSSRTSKATKA